MTEITLFNFSKRKNSTKTPSGGTQFSVSLKGECSIISPSFELNIGYPGTYNYLYWNGLFYFIEDWIPLSSSQWMCSCSIDPLASFKYDIQSTNAYVLYDSTGNTEIVDSRLSMITTATESHNTSVVPFLPISGGYYALSVTGRDGSVDTFGLNGTQLSQLLNNTNDWIGNIFEGAGGNDIGSLIDSYIRAQTIVLTAGSAPDNIRSCVYVPFDISYASGSNGEIFLGQYPTNISGKKLMTETPVQRITCVIDIPWQANDWRRNAPYHSIGLFIPHIGFINLPPSEFLETETITINFGVNFCTGEISAVLGYSGSWIGSYGGNAGMAIPIGVSNISASQALNAISSVGQQFVPGSLSRGNGATGAMLTALNIGAMAGNTIDAMAGLITPMGTCVGGLSGGTGIAGGNTIYCYSIFHDTNVSPNSVASTIGTPTMAVRNLGSISGFVQTAGASVSCNAPGEVIAHINRLLDGGIFIE